MKDEKMQVADGSFTCNFHSTHWNTWGWQSDEKMHCIIQQQDEQCQYNVTQGAFMQPLLQWKSNKYYTIWVCICKHKYPACNEHAPHCHLWPTLLYNIFPHYPTNGMVFEKKKIIEHKMCVSIFSTMFVWNIVCSKKKWVRYD